MELLYYNWLPTISDHILDLPYKFYESAGALPRHDYPDFIVENINDGELVFIKTDLLEYFFNNYYNKINVKFILITGISSITINPKYEQYLNDKIYYWIGPNIPWNNENTLKIPIGFEERDRDGGDQKVLNDALKYVNINKKDKMVVSYMSDTHPTRKQFIEKYKECDYIDFLDKLKFKDYIAKLGEYQFVLCPHGVGTDTHRFWETLLVGGVPIVETSTLDDLYSKFPCIIVKSILDIDRNLLIKPDISTNEIKNYLLTNNLKNKIMEIKKNNINISSITLPVSIGEALDKLTILDIKQRKINDKNKLDDVIKEYNLLKNELKDIINDNIQFYYNKLVDENEIIWDMLDDIKNTKYDDKDKLKLYEIMWHKNDCRYRLKQKINTIVNSDLKEQKGYKQTKAFVLTHLGMGDMIDCVGMIRYLSIQYDIVDVVCKNKYKNNVEQIFNDDKNIHIINVEEDCDISPNYGYPKKLYENIVKDYDKVYLCGNHLKMRNKDGDYVKLPFEFYEDINLDNSIYWDYFHISAPDNSKLLYNNLKNKKYIFIHDTSSLGKIFNIEEYEDSLDINDDDYIYINPCTNLYNKDHKYYDLCEKFINLPLFDYIDTIKNAYLIIITDSAFFSLSVQLEINTDKCYYITRYISRYVFWDDEYIFKNLNRKRFILLYNMQPHFAGINDLNMFYKYLKNSNYYFEYGSGGSTYQSSIHNNIKKIYSVESCLEYHLKLKELCENKDKISFIYNEMDVTPNTWGHSGINATDEQKINYSNHIRKLSKLEQEQIDLILIDGRFRVSCCLKCFDIINENTHILFDDFMNRPEYHIVLKYFDIIEKTSDNCMVCLKKKSDITIDEKDILDYNLEEN